MRQNSTARNGSGKKRETGKRRRGSCRPPRRRSAGTELLQKRRRAVIRPAQGLRFARSRNPSSTATCFSTNRMPPLGLTASPQVGGAGRCVRPSGRPGAAGPSPPGRAASGAPRAGCRRGDRPISFLQPSADEQNKKRAVRAWPRRRGKAELPPCSLCYYSTPKAVIKEVLVLLLGTEGTSKLLASPRARAATTDIPWRDGRRDVASTISLLCRPPAWAGAKAQGRTGWTEMLPGEAKERLPSQPAAPEPVAEPGLLTALLGSSYCPFSPQCWKKPCTKLCCSGSSRSTFCFSRSLGLSYGEACCLCKQARCQPGFLLRS